MAGPIQKAGTGAPTTAVKEGAIYQREDAPNGDVYVVRNGAWVSLFSGGGVTLAGDVTGPSGANVVEDITGVAGVVAMHGTVIRSDAGLSLEVASGTGSPPGEFSLRRGSNSAFLLAAGSGGSANVYLGGYPLLHLDGDVVRFRSSAGSERASVHSLGLAFSAAVGSVTISHDQDAGVGGSTTVAAQTSTDAVGGNLFLSSGAGGGGSLAGYVAITVGATLALQIQPNTPATPIARWWCDSLLWDKSLTAPSLSQEPKTADERPAVLVIESQAPWDFATDHGGGDDRRIAGHIHYKVPASTNGADELGTHVWWIGTAGSANDGKVLTVRADTIEPSVQTLSFDLGTSPSVATFTAKQIASGIGHDVAMRGGAAGGAGNDAGGAADIHGGTPTGTGAWGTVTLHGKDGPMVKVMSRDPTHHGVVLCGDQVAASLPQDITDYVLFCEATGVPNSSPVGGFILYSEAGCPVFMNENGNSLLIEGSVSGTAGAIVEYMLVRVGANQRKIALYAE